MFRKFLHFVQYHNAVNWLFLVLAFVGAGTVFAATDEGIREAVAEQLVQKTETVVEIDNSAIVNADLDNFDARLQILEVQEDDFAYYAEYQFVTLAIDDGHWGEIEKTDKITIDKESLGERDLGLFLAEELGELTAQELRYLQEVQIAERKKGSKKKKVAIEYSGLIGKLLDTKEETFDDYEPVIEEPEKIVEVTQADEVEIQEEIKIEELESGIDVVKEDDESDTEQEELGEVGTSVKSEPDDLDNGASATTTPELVEEDIIQATSTESTATTTEEVATTTPNTASTTPDTIAPVIDLDGNEIIELEVGADYIETNVTATDDIDGDVPVLVFVDDTQVETVDLDTSIVTSYHIEYKAIDGAGNETVVNRTVNIKSVQVEEQLENATEEEVEIEPEPEPEGSPNSDNNSQIDDSEQTEDSPTEGETDTTPQDGDDV